MRRLRERHGTFAHAPRLPPVVSARAAAAHRPRPAHALADVASCSYIWAMRSAGIRDLKNNLSRYIRRLRPGEAIAVTDRGRVVAELRSPEDPVSGIRQRGERYAQLVAAGVIRPAVETGDPLVDWPAVSEVSLPIGTAASLIDEDRGG